LIFFFASPRIKMKIVAPQPKKNKTKNKSALSFFFFQNCTYPHFRATCPSFSS